MSYADPHEDTLRPQYADLLLEEPGDSALTRLIRDLDGAANRPVAATIRARIGEEALAIIERQKAEVDIQSVVSPVTSNGPARQPMLLRRPSTTSNTKWPRPALRAILAASVALAVLVAVTAEARSPSAGSIQSWRSS
jgi:hypothetical protein